MGEGGVRGRRRSEREWRGEGGRSEREGRGVE